MNVSINFGGGELRKNKMMFLIISFIMSFLFLSNAVVYAAEDYIQWKTTYSISDLSKSWTIKFNYPINPSSVNESNFKMVDDSGQSIGITPVLNSDNRSVTVALKSGVKYEVGKTYTLTISKNVQKTSGDTLKQDVKMNFTVKSSPLDPPVSKDFKVVLDAGHGGQDDGLIGVNGLKEKDLTLSVALKAGEILEKNGINVIYTRINDDISWAANDMNSRFAQLSTSGASYVVSVHANNAGSMTAAGVETYYMSGNGRSQTLANLLQSNIVSKTGATNRGIKTGSMPEFTALPNIPTAKVFLGFLSNPDEEDKLSDLSTQYKYAEGIANAVMQVKNSESTIVDIVEKDVIKSVTEGGTLALPTTVTATRNNGSKEQVAVKWDKPSVNTSVAGTYTHIGTVDGYSGKIVWTILVTKSGKYTVVVDPGHGGYDPGAVGPTGLKEKDVTLAVGLKLGKLLEAKGIRVVYTRSSDVVSWPANESLDLQKRVSIANQANANYYISIHCNSAVPAANGTETYWWDGGSTASQRLATYVQQELISKLGTVDRKVKTAGFYVIKYTDAPAILTELEFISNPTAENNLRNAAFQDKCAQALADGIFKALGM